MKIPDRLRSHDVRLSAATASGHTVSLRPMTESDWALLERWNQDPEVLYYSEADDIKGWSAEQVRDIYRSISAHAFCFIIELMGTPVGEAWLEEMNLDRVLRRFQGQDVRRIDLMIGEKGHWGHGIGTEVIRMLTSFAFAGQSADLVYIPEVADYNERSLRAFQRVGYVISEVLTKQRGKARKAYDLVMTRAGYLAGAEILRN